MRRPFSAYLTGIAPSPDGGLLDISSFLNSSSAAMKLGSLGAVSSIERL